MQGYCNSGTMKVNRPFGVIKKGYVKSIYIHMKEKKGKKMEREKKDRRGTLIYI